MNRICEATPLENRRVRLQFADGVSCVADFAALAARGGVFAPLSDPAFFAQAVVSEDGRSLVWPGELEFCADALYTEREAGKNNSAS